MSVPCRLVPGQGFEVRAGETVLDACRRSAITIPFSCGAGTCHTCMLQALQGVVPPEAQRGLTPEQCDLGYLLACQCVPVGPLALALVDPTQRRGRGRPVRAQAPQPDEALWRELGNGTRVRQVLEAFYARVYADPRLAPFFDGVTIDRSIDKQYSFLRQLMTGEKVYFGDRPRNAHHWMVIDDALFDHRQQMMREQLLAAGLTAGQVARWLRLEEHYRPDIVKDRPWPRVVQGQPQPLDGYAREVLGEGSVCDHCGSAVEAGVEVAYHLRLGTISCPQCTGETLVGAG